MLEKNKYFRYCCCNDETNDNVFSFFVHYLKYDIYRERRILLILLYYIIEINFLYNFFLHLQYIRLDICFYFFYGRLNKGRRIQIKTKIRRLQKQIESEARI